MKKTKITAECRTVKFLTSQTKLSIDAAKLVKEGREDFG